MSAVFLDTSALFAAARLGADRHAACRLAFEQVMRGGDMLLTTELVLAELHALTLSRHGPAPALALLDRVGGSARIEVVAVDEGRREAALQILRARSGRPYSLADAVSFAVMRERRVTVAFTLDDDFAAEGFSILPEPADTP